MQSSTDEEKKEGNQQDGDANLVVGGVEASEATVPTQEDPSPPRPEDLGPPPEDPEPQPEDPEPQPEDPEPQPEDPEPQPEDPEPQPDPDLSTTAPMPHLLSPNTSEDMMNLELHQEDEEEELLILDPEHLLVKRLQDALNIQFKKNLEKIKQELNEKRTVKKAEETQSQESGVEVFTIQEQLARKQNKMEDLHQTRAQAEAKRREAQDQLEGARTRYSDISQQIYLDEANVSKLQAELDKVAQHLVLTQGVSEDLRSKVKTMKNVRRRAGAEKTQAEEQILQQDLYVERLTKELERLEQQVAMFESQRSAQAEETQAAKEALSETEMEMESQLMMRKQLLQLWNSSLVRIRRNDEVFGAKQEAVRSITHQGILLNTEIEGYKKVIAAEHEKNETRTVQLNWCEMDCATSVKLISQKKAEQEALQAQYSACLRSLRETERTLAALTKDSGLYQTELNNQKKQSEKESSVRLELEEKIMTHIQQQLTHSKAAKYSQHLTSRMGALRKDKMIQLHQMENDLLSVKLESQTVSQRVSSLTLIEEALNEETTKYNKLLTSQESDFSAFVRSIEQKQAKIGSLKTKISTIVALTGHEDLSPLQIKVQAKTSQAEELAADIRSNQQLWLLQQGTLVGLTKDLEANSQTMLKLQMECTKMQQKKMRLDSQIEQEGREKAELEKNSRILRRDQEKLNDLLSRNKQLSQALEQENTLMETHFLHTLKEAEWESVDIQMKVEKTQEEKEILLESLLEAEQQVMLWEKKTQILKETHSTLDSEVFQDEIQKMKAEIHRMELRISQLNKQQEQLMRESEAAVVKREHILLRKEAMARSSHREFTATELKLSKEGLKRTIQKTHKEVADCKQVICELERSEADLGEKIEQQKQELTKLTCTSQNLDSEFGNFQDNKDMKQAHLIALQNRNKKLKEVCEGSYRLSSTSETVGVALQSQQERLESVGSVLHGVCVEFPHHQGALHMVSQAVRAYRQISQLKAAQQ